jgi:hypothetical protein
VDLAVRKKIVSVKGQTLLRIAKEARKASCFQTSYSAVLLAIEANADLGYVERAKWAWAQGSIFLKPDMKHEAMMELKSDINSLLPNVQTDDDKLALAKVFELIVA